MAEAARRGDDGDTALGILQRIEPLLRDIQGELGDQRQALNGLREDLGSLRGEVHAQGQAIGGLRDETTTLRGEVAAQGQAIGAVQNELGEQRRAIAALHSDLGAQGHALSSLHTALDTQRQGIEAVQGEQYRQATALAEQRGQVSQLPNVWQVAGIFAAVNGIAVAFGFGLANILVP